MMEDNATTPGAANCFSVRIPNVRLDCDSAPRSPSMNLRDARVCLGLSPGKGRGFGGFASLSVAEEGEKLRRKWGCDDMLGPSPAQLAKHPLAVAALVPRDAALFFAGAMAGAAAKTVTVPLDRIKLLMQTHGVRFGNEGAKKAISFAGAITMIGQEEGIKGYWKGNFPQKLFRGKDGELSVIGRLVAGQCPRIKKALPEEFQKKTEASLLTALISAGLATMTCYPLDTVRRQMQMKGTPYKTVFDAFTGIIEHDGLIGLYRGFLPNALKTLPNSSIRLTTFDTVKH